MVYGVSVNELNQFVSCSHDSTGLSYYNYFYFGFGIFLVWSIRLRFFL